MLFYCKPRDLSGMPNSWWKSLKMKAASGGVILRHAGNGHLHGRVEKFRVSSTGWSILLIPQLGVVEPRGKGYPDLDFGNERWVLEDAINRLWNISHGKEVAFFPAGNPEPIPTSVARSARSIKSRDVDYKEYLKSPEWQKKRLRALNAAAWRCAKCSTEADLQVHHRSYRRLGREPLRDLQVLCGRCHKMAHAVEDSRKDEATATFVSMFR